jgi:hypothetical protein
VEQPDRATVDRWHRWFAVECNNRAWDLTEREQRSPDEEQEMLLAAYASVFHWSKVGTPVNGMRGDLLLAHVLALHGRGAEALICARRCLAFCETGEADEWDVAFTHLEMALSAAAAGDAALHVEHRRRARELGEALADPGDRKVFAAAFARLPSPTESEEDR